MFQDYNAIEAHVDLDVADTVPIDVDVTHPAVAIPVTVEGVVQVDPTPPANVGFFTLAGVGTTPVRALTADPRRRRATVIGLSQNIRIGNSQSQAQLAGIVWPAVVPVVITSRDEVWVSATSNTSDISIMVEQVI